MLSESDKWNLYFLLGYYPIFGLREVFLECGLDGKTLKGTLENLLRAGYIQEIDKEKFRFKANMESLLEILKDLKLRDWDLDDCWGFYKILEDHERKILRRLIYTPSRVSVGVLMGLVGSKGYFKILGFSRKVCSFSRENYLKVPIKKEVFGGKRHLLICDENFREKMFRVFETSL
jgi:hypothetical protein